MKKLFNTYDSFVLVFRDKKPLENGIEKVQSSGQEILDIQSTHFIDIKKLKETKKPDRYGIISGISGAIGLILISLLIFYVMGKPQLLLGNKGSLPIMAYVPVLFTVSILFSALGLILAFSIRNHLLPGQQNQIIDKLVSSEHYVLMIYKKMTRDELEDLIRDIDYTNIFEHKFIEQNISLPLPLKVR